VASPPLGLKTCALNVNLFSGARTALPPATQVYVLRWIAGRHAGVPNFEPPYTLE
jgi:hypothetical protein